MADIAVDSYMLKNISKEISNLASAISALDYEVSAVRSDVGDVSRELTSTRSELLELTKAFHAYVEQAQRTAAVQHAETRRGNLEAELERQYGHYSIVRRTSVGVLQAFDVANVSDDVVAHVSEELMIQSPRYWLAPALVGIAAWSRDDKEIAQRSIDEAFKRDAAKTSLFFALVLRRTARVEASVRWLRHYLNNCTSSALTREFAVILEASSQGAFGPSGAQLVADKISAWNKELRMSDEINASQVKEWKSELFNNSRMLARDEYTELRDVCPDFVKVENMLSAATSLGNTAEEYQEVRDDTYSAPGMIADLLDDLLEQLVTEYDEEELPLRREAAYNQAIIDTDGDMKRAEEMAAQYQRAFEETIDAVTLQTRTAISPDLLGVSVQTQKVSVGVGKTDFLNALNEYTREYRSQAVTEVDIVLDSTHTGHASAFNFVGHRSSTSLAEETALTQLKERWESTFKSYIESISFKQSIVYLPAVIVALVGIIGLFINPLVGLLILAIGGGAVVLWAQNKKKQADDAVEAAHQAKEEAFEASKQVLLAARAAFVDAMFEYEELEEDEAKLRELIETWPIQLNVEDNTVNGKAL